MLAFSITHRSAASDENGTGYFLICTFRSKEIRWLEDDEISWMGESMICFVLRWLVIPSGMAYHDAEEKDLENRISEVRMGKI